MNTTLIVTGAVFVAAAIVGTGLEGAGIKIPALDKRWQHFCLAGLGILVIATGALPQFLANDAPVSRATANRLGATAAPTVGSASSSPSGASAQSDPSTSQTPLAPQTSKQNGAVLGSYTVDLPTYYSIPLGVSKPTQSQFDSSEQNGDLDDGDYCNFTSDCYHELNGDRIVELQRGSTPKYHTCAASTAFTDYVSSGVGVAFCVLEGGKIAGVKVISQSSTSSDYILKVTVWRNAS